MNKIIDINYSIKYLKNELTKIIMFTPLKI